MAPSTETIEIENRGNEGIVLRDQRGGELTLHRGQATLSINGGRPIRVDYETALDFYQDIAFRDNSLGSAAANIASLLTKGETEAKAVPGSMQELPAAKLTPARNGRGPG